MLFHEIYSLYYQTIAKILGQAVEGKLTGPDLLRLVRQTAFPESSLRIPQALESGEWPLLEPDFRTPLCHAPEMPLTLLEKRWLKSLLLDPRIRRKLFPADRPIYTKERNDASTYLDPDGTCLNSLVADGCTIQGTVENSILFRGVTVAKGAVVRDCILMQDVTVGPGANLRHIIADKNVQVGEGITLSAAANCPMAVAKDTVI